MNQKKYNTVIVGATSIISEGLKTILNKNEQFSVIRIITSPDELFKFYSKVSSDLVVVDVSHKKFQISILTELKFKPNPPAVLVILDSITSTEFRRYSEIGIENLLLKNSTEQEILNAADSAVNRRKYYSSEILDMILESIEIKQPAELNNRLTFSEKEIVRLIAGGYTTKEIASYRNISFHTVNTHRKNIFRKLEVNNASELIMTAIKAGWIDNIEYYI